MSVRRCPTQLVLFVCIWMLAISAHSGESTKLKALLPLGIPNLLEPELNVLVGGQPGENDFEYIAQKGVRHVINLRPATEQDWDQSGAVATAGMEYHHIPIDGGAGINLENAQRLQEALDSIHPEPVLLHCASGNRVGALIALQSAASGHEIEQSIAKGKRWGLTRLEQTVRNKVRSLAASDR